MSKTTTGTQTLCDALDRALTKGVVVRGEVIVSVAGIDLLYLGLDALASSVETARREVPGAWIHQPHHQRLQADNPGDPE